MLCSSSKRGKSHSEPMKLSLVATLFLKCWGIFFLKKASCVFSVGQKIFIDLPWVQSDVMGP